MHSAHARLALLLAPVLGAASLAFAQTAPVLEAIPVPPPPPAGQDGSRMMYTTYFYTAGEAVIQGYERDTHVRVFALESREPIYAGTVGEGDAVHVPTGAGVFGFVSDKKAAILVGTPSSCAVVGYWGRDPEGSFVSDHLFVRLPATSAYEDDRVVLWVTEPSHVTVRDRTTNRMVYEGDLPERGRYVIPHSALASMGEHVLDVRSDKRSALVQVYYDEGFTVPSHNGRAVGREFTTYIGRTTEGVNDLILTSYHGDTTVTVTDLVSEEVIYRGPLREARAHTITLHERYVRVRAEQEISVAVAPYVHYQGPYAEHHFSSGAEGTGIDTDFIVTSPRDLWIFSYFGNNQVTVEDMATGRQVSQTTLQAGGFQGVQPGHGIYRIRSTRGTSVMGGAQSCGGEYSPAGRLFAVDDAVMRAVQRVHQQRQEQARARGETLSPAAAAAPMTEAEVQQVTGEVRRATQSRSIDAAS